MKRSFFVLLSIVAIVAPIACTHDWSLALTGDDAGTDGSPADSAGPDGSPEAGGFDCAGSVLCDTFDGPPLSAIWDDVQIGAGGGRAEREAFAGARSPPNVFLTERPAQTTGPSTAYASKILTQSLRRVRLELDISPSALDATEYATLAAIVFEDERPNEHKLRLAMRGNAAQIQELGATSTVLASHDLPNAIPTDAWTHVAFEIEVGGRVRATVDETKVIDDPAASSWQPSTRTRLIVGINFVTGSHQGVRVRIDNVRVDGS
jgi:hypothetical protein